MVNEILLNNSWSFYFHDPNDRDWTIDSYKLLFTINSVESFCYTFLHFKKYWEKGMFFIMRNTNDGRCIKPIWEDVDNKEGGCFSLKLYINDFENIWFNLCSSVLGETLSIDAKNTYNINGISISFKKKYYIIRIWCKDNNLSQKELYNIQTVKYSPLLYKKHND
jgi:translation initiation factor 4E